MPYTTAQEPRATRRWEPAPPATGRREHHDDTDWVVYLRRLPLPVAEAWSLLTSPGQLARWIGAWRGPDGGGAGELTLAYEGDDVLPVRVRVDEVVPPRQAVLALFDPGDTDAWRLDVRLAPAGRTGDQTELTVRQSILNPALAPAVAAGCEFYLDRLVAVVEGGDPAALDFDAYFIRQAAHYRRLFPVQRSGRES